MRLGILGGTFDPIHFGHLKVAESCLKKLNLNLILFIPSGNPPLKKVSADYIHRLKMLKLALKGYTYFKVVELEKKRFDNQPTYTYNTLKTIKKLYPKAYRFFLIGEDNVPELKKWYRYKELFKYAEFIVLTRNVNSKKSWTNLEYYDKLKFVNTPLIDISSNTIRNNVMNNLPIKGLLPKNVENYIKENKLYSKLVTNISIH